MDASARSEVTVRRSTRENLCDTGAWTSLSTGKDWRQSVAGVWKQENFHRRPRYMPLTSNPAALSNLNVDAHFYSTCYPQGNRRPAYLLRPYFWHCYLPFGQVCEKNRWNPDRAQKIRGCDLHLLRKSTCTLWRLCVVAFYYQIY